MTQAPQPTLPVFRTLVQSMAVFGLHAGRIILWSLVALLLFIVVLALVFGAVALLEAAGAGSGLRYLPIVAAMPLLALALVPLSMRINQLAVLGRAEPTGYMALLFSWRSLRYFGYWILVTLATVAGLGLAALPTIMASGGASGTPGPMLPAGIAVSVVLGIVFLVLTAPLNLVYPAASVEDEPSLKASFHLGWDAKFRLFACVALLAVLFTAITSGIEAIPELFDEDSRETMRLVLLPVQAFVTLFSFTSTTALPGVAYRVLSGLPDPGAREGGAPEKTDA